MNFAVLPDHRVKSKEIEKRDKYIDLSKENMENEGDRATNNKWCTWNDPQRLGKETGRVGNQRTSEEHLVYIIIMIG